MRSLCLLLALLSLSARASIFGEENIPLMKLVIGQIEEISQMSEAIGVAKDQAAALRDLNRGVTELTSTIESIEEVVRRAQGIDPSSVRRISDLTQLINEVKDIRSKTEELLLVRTQIAEVAVTQGGIQAETAYAMGGEMVKVGSQLNSEVKTASPGRAAQISASASTNSMLSQGVQLQTLAQIAQMQAISLDLQKAEIQERIEQKRSQDATFTRLATEQRPKPRLP